jgi:hypothetical protein
MMGKSFLDLKMDKDRVTYWEKRKNSVIVPTDYERQF